MKSEKNHTIINLDTKSNLLLALYVNTLTNNMAASSVNVCVESVIENQIQEVSYDGQEIYVA